MSVEDFGDWEDKVSASDITLAASKLRRKSIRRSMMIVTSESPIGYSSPKITVRRKSLGAILKDNYASPIPPTPVPHHSLSFLEENKRKRVEANTEQPLQLLPHKSPTPDGFLTTASKQPNFKENFDPTDPSTRLTNYKGVKSPKLLKNSVVNSATFLPDSVDTLFENYERELKEWPKFLERLKHEASSTIPVPRMKREEVMENSMLSPFADFIFSEDSSMTVRELQYRTKRAYTSVMAGLIRAKLAIKRLKASMAEIECERVALKDAKLKELLPCLALNPDPMNANELLSLIPCLRMNDVSSL